jgi:hypothetical protein
VDFDLPLATLPAGQAVAPQEPDLAGAAVIRIESIPQGQARYNEFKALPRFLLQDVTARIGAQLAMKMEPGKSLKQSEYAFYFFGDIDGARHIDTVRRFMSTNKCWGP